MTELFEVQDFRGDLAEIRKLIEYEAKSMPGEGPEVKNLLNAAILKINEALELLDQAEKIMERNIRESET